jgi:hypothetical protein
MDFGRLGESSHLHPPSHHQHSWQDSRVSSGIIGREIAFCQNLLLKLQIIPSSLPHSFVHDSLLSIKQKVGD